MSDLKVSVTFLWPQSVRKLFPGPHPWSPGSVCTQTAHSLEVSRLRQGGHPPGRNVSKNCLEKSCGIFSRKLGTDLFFSPSPAGWPESWPHSPSASPQALRPLFLLYRQSLRQLQFCHSAKNIYSNHTHFPYFLFILLRLPEYVYAWFGLNMYH